MTYPSFCSAFITISYATFQPFYLPDLLAWFGTTAILAPPAGMLIF
jgi:hypothetical protein